MDTMQLSFDVSSVTHAGKVRERNEDSCLVRTDTGFWAVADGMGGHEAGDLASRILVESLNAIAEPEAALDLLEVDRYGLDEIDQKIMLTLLEKYSGGPVGVNTIAASIDEEADTIEEVYEPYLMQLGFIDRTPRGRIGTDRAFDYFKIPRRMRSGIQNPLF